MATAVYIPVSEYLQTTYRPDCDYVDGEVLERNLGEQPHGLVQKMVAFLFTLHWREWGLRAITEQRIQVTATRFRVPDVCVVKASEPIAGVLQTPPFICVEVLSPTDRLHAIVTRTQEYQQMGVAHIWIVDPLTRETWTLDANGGALPMVGDAFTVLGTPVRLSIHDIFEEIDAASHS